MSASRTSTRLSSAKEIALAFAGSGVASASGWHDFRCPAHDDKTASCGIKDDRGGKIAIKCHAGCERDAILDAIEAKGLVVRQRSNRRAEKKPPEELFGDARIVEPSLLYFPARGLDSAAFPVLSRAVRFAPRFWHAASKAETPALIVALTDEAGQVRAIQRLYLTADCRAKTCRPMSLGKISGLANQTWTADRHALRRRRTGRRHDGAAGVRGQILGLGGGGLKQHAEPRRARRGEDRRLPRPERQGRSAPTRQDVRAELGQGCAKADAKAKLSASHGLRPGQRHQ